MQYPYATFFDAEGEDFVPEQYRAWKAVNDQCLQMIAQGIDSPELDALSIQEKHLREVAEDAYDEYVRVHFKRHSTFPVEGDDRSDGEKPISQEDRAWLDFPGPDADSSR